MYINYTTTQTILPLDLGSCLPHNHLVFTVEKVVNELDDSLFKGFYHEEGRPSVWKKSDRKILR